MIKLNPKKLRVAIMMGNAVMAKAVMIVLGWYAGGKLDARLGTQPWFMVFGICFGIGFGLWYILLIAKKNSLID